MSSFTPASKKISNANSLTWLGSSFAMVLAEKKLLPSKVFGSSLLILVTELGNH